jgi:hypothetical protein
MDALKQNIRFVEKANSQMQSEIPLRRHPPQTCG